MINMEYTQIASRVKELRTKKINEDRKNKAYWSLKALSTRIGISAQRLHLLESGVVKKPSAEILFNLANEFGTTYEYLLLGHDEQIGVISLEIPINKNKISDSIKINVKSVMNL